ncbi:G protein-coupled receptor, rhodopsin-like family and GPCR, rhodopsin-like, 7TM domain-containing protein [Strongyloides ratti]|uniref:G protein-coupled receptor, rhodopsin-like family and GPCR, rhodopsin-like, 7TM domain-containing protein n=1 Tax=Strongyloides ratti TaxID=34506 RepID=A0A090KSU2_STRRB|nr:G protein-coupled receptor, rhodopsin-like family and GPCR, rhodopsin-like, 7TM domain-containing protein [Strongyloides ratti]CEF60570.1 G protein-coupled receptor, rhodopsin-like family and GPCR, rhodopsin-like, 7TM domain-containing protein [Strongyloides ratti]
MEKYFPKHMITKEDLLNRNISEENMRKIFKLFQIHRLTDRVLGSNSCEESYLYKLLMGKIFLGVFAIALVGNITNILIYSSDQIRKYITIKLLRSKLVLNTITLILLLPHTLRILEIWEKGSIIDYYYYIFWPLELFFVNLFGFCATWITVFMAAECIMTSFTPGYSKILWTKKNVILSYIVLIILGTLMAIIYPLNRRVIFNVENGKTKVIISTSDYIIISKIEKVHTIINLVITIIIPLVLLILLTVILFYRFVFLRKTKTGVILKFTNEKKCVVKISLLTTILFILSEIPSIPIFINSYTKGSHVVNNDTTMCRWLSFSHFCGICNSSLSFIIYFIFSKRFRTSLVNVVKSTYIKYIQDWINIISKNICKRETKTLGGAKNVIVLNNNFKKINNPSFSDVTMQKSKKVIFINNNEYINSGYVKLLS